MNTKDLPNDTQELKKIISDYQYHVSYLEEKIDLLQKAIFGTKSEKSSNAQSLENHLPLPGFEMAEPESKEQHSVTVPEHTRQKRGRKPLPPDLPREEIVHDISEEDKVCACGTSLTCIGQEVSEKLHYVPSRLCVHKHIRRKYACRGCEGVESQQGAVVTAPMPAQLIPQGIATPSLLAHILVAKFVDALPFYRQEKQFARLGVDLSRSTMVAWAMSAARACEPLLGLFKKDLLADHFLGIDETPVQVLNESGKANTTKSYMWVFLGGSAERPTVLYQYHPSRSGKALDFLQNFTGYIQTDGYAAYEALGERPGVTHVGCLAHVRRKFMDVIKISKRAKAKGGVAQEVLDRIAQLYNLEQTLAQQKLEPGRIKEQREQYAVPILEEIKSILDQGSLSTPPKSQLGKAIAYALNQWDRVVRYVEHGRIRPDNNLVENAIRPFALGRKNWLFAGHPNGAHAGALFFSLMETAKLNGLEPYAYLCHLFEHLPRAQDEQDLQALLPQYIDPALIQTPSAG